MEIGKTIIVSFIELAYEVILSNVLSSCVLSYHDRYANKIASPIERLSLCNGMQRHANTNYD